MRSVQGDGGDRQGAQARAGAPGGAEPRGSLRSAATRRAWFVTGKRRVSKIGVFTHV